MKNARDFMSGRGLLLVAALLAPLGGAAQQALVKGQVQGSRLQLWLDNKFTYAGVHHGSGCFFMNTASSGQGRVLFMSCPNGWSAKMEGTVRVVGDTFCTNFPIPNQPQAEECLTWHTAAGDNRFEQRKGSFVSTALTVLSVVPMGNR
jgi:hypothetical protein